MAKDTDLKDQSQSHEHDGQASQTPDTHATGVSAVARGRWIAPFLSGLRAIFVPDQLPSVRDIAKYLPLIAAIIAPMSTLMDIPALSQHWYTYNGGNMPDPVVCIVLSAIGLALNLSANLLLVARFSGTSVWKKGTSLSLVFWIAKTLVALVNLLYFGATMRNGPGYRYAEGFWCAVASICMSGIISCALLFHYIFSFGHGEAEQEDLRLQGRKFMVSVTLLMVLVGFQALAFNRLEHWSYLDAIYFSLQTAFTVGYGDLVATTAAGKVLVFPFAVLTISQLANEVSLIVDFVQNRSQKKRDRWRKRYSVAMHHEALKRRPFATLVDEMSLIHQIQLHQESMVQLYDLFWSGMTLLVFWLIGGLIFHYIEGWGYGNALYAVMVLSLTIGFGDYTPKTPGGRVFWICYAMMAVPIVTNFAVQTVTGIMYTWAEHRFTRARFEMERERDPEVFAPHSHFILRHHEQYDGARHEYLKSKSKTPIKVSVATRPDQQQLQASPAIMEAEGGLLPVDDSSEKAGNEKGDDPKKSKSAAPAVETEKPQNGHASPTKSPKAKSTKVKSKVKNRNEDEDDHDIQKEARTPEEKVITDMLEDDTYRSDVAEALGDSEFAHTSSKDSEQSVDPTAFLKKKASAKGYKVGKGDENKTRSDSTGSSSSNKTSKGDATDSLGGSRVSDSGSVSDDESDADGTGDSKSDSGSGSGSDDEPSTNGSSDSENDADVDGTGDSDSDSDDDGDASAVGSDTEDADADDEADVNASQTLQVPRSSHSPANEQPGADKPARPRINSSVQPHTHQYSKSSLLPRTSAPPQPAAGPKVLIPDNGDGKHYDDSHLELDLIRNLVDSMTRLEAQARQMLIDSMDEDLARTLLLADRNLQIRDAFQLYTINIQKNYRTEAEKTRRDKLKRKLQDESTHQAYMMDSEAADSDMLSRVRRYRDTFAEVLVLSSTLLKLEGDDLQRFERWHTVDLHHARHRKNLAGDSQQPPQRSKLGRISDWATGQNTRTTKKRHGPRLEMHRTKSFLAGLSPVASKKHSNTGDSPRNHHHFLSRAEKGKMPPSASSSSHPPTSSLAGSSPATTKRDREVSFSTKDHHSLSDHSADTPTTSPNNDNTGSPAQPHVNESGPGTASANATSTNPSAGPPTSPRAAPKKQHKFKRHVWENDTDRILQSAQQEAEAVVRDVGRMGKSTNPKIKKSWAELKEEWQHDTEILRTHVEGYARRHESQGEGSGAGGAGAGAGGSSGGGSGGGDRGAGAGGGNLSPIRGSAPGSEDNSPSPSLAPSPRRRSRRRSGALLPDAD